jgi:hypothetical protein
MSKTPYRILHYEVSPDDPYDPDKQRGEFDGEPFETVEKAFDTALERHG